MENNQITVTIGIPIFNVADCLEPSLLSALSQSYQNIDYILVDDCGTDNSMEIAESIISKSDRKDHIRIVHHTVNKGLGEARNTALAHSKTDYIYFQDSDDILPSDAIEKLVGKAIINNHPDIVVGSHAKRTLTGEETIIQPSETELVLSNREQILSYYKQHGLIVSSWNKLFSVRFLNENNIRYIHRIHEDCYFALQELHYAHSIVLVPDVTYFYLLRQGSITNGLMVSEKTVNALSQVQQDIYLFIKQNNSNDVLYYRSYLLLLIYSFILALRINSNKAKDIINHSSSGFADLKYFKWSDSNVYVKLYLISLLIPKVFRYRFNKVSFKTVDLINSFRLFN